MQKESLINQVKNIRNHEELQEIIKDLRVVSANEKSETVLEIIRRAVKWGKKLDHKISIVNLYELEIKQLFHKKISIKRIKFLLTEMFRISEEINYSDGLILAHSIKWGILKLEGRIKESTNALRKVESLLSNTEQKDEYVYYMCKYSLAFEDWMLNHNSEVANDFEKCNEFFFKEGFYRSLAQTYSFLSVIYTRKQEGKKALDMGNQILANRSLFENLPHDVQGIIYYFTGLGHMLEANLVISESYFNEAYTVLKRIYKDSIYFSNFIILHSYLATVKGLQGKTNQAYSSIKEAKIILQSEFIKKNLDENSEKQIVHTLNLVDFYNISRLGNYTLHEHQVLIGEIIENCKDLYSDFMTLSEFILSANLGSDKLQLLLAIDNFSINRVKHLIEFMLEKQKLDTEISKEQRSLNCISILKNREVTTKTTFMEHAYVDLLVAQQLFSLKRYAEISPLLKKYENRLKQIEVLEMRIFMETFIQVGAFKSGDPLGPALQYMAIKKCRIYGFSRLENKLLNYLQLQYKEIKRTV
ncbi:MAG: hypothetical protein KGD64_01590 [Candidatus Heimdallarchaeota archaeon]|nr:hypothetical protein [Candidatus Heimdallarchaeota archaeon]